MVDIGGIKVARTGSRLLTAEDVAEVTAHIERLEAENAKLHALLDEALRELEIASKFKAFVVLGDEDRS